MDFDIVIATRNRHSSLELSLPLMLGQARLPGRLVIVDASDDFARTKELLQGIASRVSGNFCLDLVQSEPGASRQRNLGLTRVGAPIVFFPDDDALWFPGFADAIMRIYERDAEGLIGAVGGTESDRPPPGLLPGVRAPTDGLNVKLPGIVEQLANTLERKYFPDPLFAQARIFSRQKKTPEWLAEEEAVLTNTITGFRMSFRTELIRRTGFDETLSRYSLFEDHDACMGVLATHCLVDARRARVFHHRLPQKRADELELGVMHILNRAYILWKRRPSGFELESLLWRYAYYKTARYLLRAYSRSGRRRLRGAWRAARCVSSLRDTLPGDATKQYVSLRNACLTDG